MNKKIKIWYKEYDKNKIQGIWWMKIIGYKEYDK